MKCVKINSKKFLVSIIICGLLVLCLGFITASRFANQHAEPHNCRFWGMVFRGELDTVWEQRVRDHLEELKQLGGGSSGNNTDGWGIGYYVLPPELTQMSFLPVISRGRPAADDDETRYDNAVDELIYNIEGGSIGHVRKGTSGPSGIAYPNPHPFRRNALNRNFDVLFAHNGWIVYTDKLIDLIGDYIDDNPPDYNPDYLDSDLYAIYIMKVIDSLHALPIDNCITIAISNLVEKLHEDPFEYARLNFVMTDGFTLWALRYAEISQGYYTLYYYPNDVDTDKWVVASVEMDNDPGWELLDNYTLLVFRPGVKVDTFDLSPPDDRGRPPRDLAEETSREHGTGSFTLNKLYPNPCADVVNIIYSVPAEQRVCIKLYDATGRVAAHIFDGAAQVGSNNITYRTEHLPNGIYLLRLETDKKQITEKIVIHQ